MAKKEKDYDLVIVESPHKATTIGQFLGDGFVVKSSYGHIRDLKKNNFGVEIENNYEPAYIVPEDKQDVVAELTKLTKKAGAVWLASDEDREGEAISWHLAQVLGLDEKTTKRIVFHEITKEAILNAIKNPRTINMNLVDAQQARRVLDRLVGFELSPVLWRKVKPSLSAGRVQSVAVRILVEREREIFAFKTNSSYQTTANFSIKKAGKTYKLKAELSKRFATKDETHNFIEGCAGRQFVVSQVEKKPITRVPAPPFTTSTLQQEAGRKLSFSVSQTMQVAQRLYEAGLITYMRTDSVNLAGAAIKSAEQEIVSTMGAEYHKARQYKTKSKGAQEAHEAIRPTYLNRHSIDGTPQEQKLYQLIWQRTIASQMADAQIERTTIQVDAQQGGLYFSSAAEVITFDGFMKVYLESTDDEAEDKSVTLPSVSEGDELTLVDLSARERWTQRPARYNEPALVKKLEELGIGRPSTYAPTISTIQQRGYVVKENREGTPRQYTTLRLDGSLVVEEQREETFGAEKGKLFPTDIGMVVNDFLLANFGDVMSYDFTASVEQQFDEIAEGELKWQTVIDDFYKPFHAQVENTMETSQKSTGERELGIDPKTGKKVIVRIGRFGPMAQIGEAATDDDEEKPRFSSLRHGQHIETITLEEALSLFELPRHLGKYEDKEVVIGIGRFGPYIRHDSKFVSLKKDVDDPYTIDLETSIERIEEKREADRQKLIKEFAEDADMRVLNGRWGPYIAYGKNNIKIPKGTEAAELTYEQCKALADAQMSDKPKAKGKAKAASEAEEPKKTAAKKTTATKAKAATAKAKTATAKAKPVAKKAAKKE